MATKHRLDNFTELLLRLSPVVPLPKICFTQTNNTLPCSRSICIFSTCDCRPRRPRPRPDGPTPASGAALGVRPGTPVAHPPGTHLPWRKGGSVVRVRADNGSARCRGSKYLGCFRWITLREVIFAFMSRAESKADCFAVVKMIQAAACATRGTPLKGSP